MKELKKVIVSLVFLVIFFFRAKSIGFGFEELIANVNINLEAVLKVALIIAFLSVVKYLLKLLISLIRFEWAATFVTITLILMVVWSLRLLGADINGIIAGLGILALIIGTSAEGLIEDMLTGIFMLFEREFKVGDIIEVDGFLGKVTEIGIRTTTLIDGAGNIKIFNNSSMKDILNRSAHRSVAVVDISLPADTDLEKVTEADYGDIKCLGLQEIGSDEVSIRFVKETPEAELYNTIRDMNVVILKKLRELGLR